jgi:hypothetical protein
MFDLEKSSGVGIAQIKSCVFYPRPPNKNYNDDDAMGSLEYLIINQFAANDSQFGVIAQIKSCVFYPPPSE